MAILSKNFLLTHVRGRPRWPSVLRELSGGLRLVEARAFASGHSLSKHQADSLLQKWVDVLPSRAHDEGAGASDPARRLGASLRIDVELHFLDDITEPPGHFADVLVNAGNEGLVGTQQSYFSRGEYLERRFQTKLPDAWMASSQWCGMSAGPDMLYRSQCVDGMVHLKGGRGLRSYLLDMRNFPVIETTHTGDEKRCETGSIAWSPAFGDLTKHFPEGILHAVAPHYRKDEDWRGCLIQCYRGIVQECEKLLLKRPGVSYEAGPSLSVAVPLLGTGVRGIPLIEGAEAAATAMQSSRDESATWRPTDDSNKLRTLHMRFVTIDKDEATSAAIADTFGRVLAA